MFSDVYLERPSFLNPAVRGDASNILMCEGNQEILEIRASLASFLQRTQGCSKARSGFDVFVHVFDHLSLCQCQFRLDPLGGGRCRPAATFSLARLRAMHSEVPPPLSSWKQIFYNDTRRVHLEKFLWPEDYGIAWRSRKPSLTQTLGSFETGHGSLRLLRASTLAARWETRWLMRNFHNPLSCLPSLVNVGRVSTHHF